MTKKHCIFCDFVSDDWRKHKNKFVFEKLFETKLTLSFLSIDFPSPKRIHVLVIPKKHYVNLQDCPKNVLHELIEHVTIISKALRLEHEGANILLNDGRSAEQTVMHSHFHIVPRNKGDNIEIEIWKRVNVSQKTFSKLNKEVRKLILKTNKASKTSKK